MEQNNLTDSKKKTVNTTDRIDLEWIVIGKKTGLSLSEINEFRIKDLAAYVDIYLGTEKDEPRQATQEDIDKFFTN